MINLSKNLRNFTVLPVLTGILLVLSGCSPSPEGDGGVSGAVSGLEMATTMSVVTPTGTGVTGINRKFSAKSNRRYYCNTCEFRLFPRPCEHKCLG